MDAFILVLRYYEICSLLSPSLLHWVYPQRNHRETSQWSFLVKASWHPPLIYPLTKEKEQENWTQLRTETLFKEFLNWKRVLASDTHLWLHPCHLFSTELLHQLQLESHMCTGSKGWVEPLLPCNEAHATLVPAGDIWGREKNKCTLLWKLHSWVVWPLRFAAHFSCTVHSLSFVSPENFYFGDGTF